MKNVLRCFILTGRIYCLSSEHQLPALKRAKSKYVNKNCQIGMAKLLKFGETDKLCLVYATREIKCTFYRIQLLYEANDK